MDIEIMIPVDKRIKNAEKFYYKEKLKIGNALMAKHVGNPMGLQDTCRQFNQYIIEHSLQTITMGYNVTKKTDVLCSENTVVYMGISQNIL